MYYVTYWDTNEAMVGTTNLNKAKKWCRRLGHTGELVPNGRYPPVAYVANENGECVYNPIFRLNADAAVKLILGKEGEK